MNFYHESFGLEIVEKKSITVLCVCGSQFNHGPRSGDQLFRCDHCNELWHFEVRKDDQRCSLTRPRTNAQIHVDWKFD